MNLKIFAVYRPKPFAEPQAFEVHSHQEQTEIDELLEGRPWLEVRAHGSFGAVYQFFERERELGRTDFWARKVSRVVDLIPG